MISIRSANIRRNLGRDLRPDYQVLVAPVDAAEIVDSLHLRLENCVSRKPCA